MVPKLRTTVRFPDDLVRRAEAVARAKGRDARQTRHGDVTASHVLRDAAASGLLAMEQVLGLDGEATASQAAA